MIVRKSKKHSNRCVSETLPVAVEDKMDESQVVQSSSATKINEQFSAKDIDLMNEALIVARRHLESGEVPVGCFFVYKGEIIASGGNTVNQTKNATRHAEINCIDQVLEWCLEHDLDFTTVFRDIEVIVTVEPCVMCGAALHMLHVKRIVYGCNNDRFGGCVSVFNSAVAYKTSCKIQGGLFTDRAMDLLKKFYKGENPNAPDSKVKKK